MEQNTSSLSKKGKNMKGSLVFICTALIILFCTTSCTEKSTQSSQQNPEQELADEAVKAIISIFNGSIEYHQDYGEDPGDVSELLSLEYSIIDEPIDKHWDFSIIGGGLLTSVIAESSAEMPYGEGKVISFNSQTGKFSGWFCDRPKPERDYAGEAQRAIPALHNGLKMYRRDYGENPEGGVDDLLDKEYLRLVKWVLNDWKFSYEGSETPTAIKAISTAQMDYGEGKVVAFNLRTGRFSGWFSDNPKPEKDFSDEAQWAIRFLYNALKLYREEKGGSPFVSVKELWEIWYFQPDEWVLNEWEFSFVGSDSITGIKAVSTAQMHYGEGKIIHFGLTRQEFSGWIFTDGSPELQLAVYMQYVQGVRRRG